jgi:hypothetical protein
MRKTGHTADHSDRETDLRVGSWEVGAHGLATKNVTTNGCGACVRASTNLPNGDVRCLKCDASAAL